MKNVFVLGLRKTEFLNAIDKTQYFCKPVRLQRKGVMNAVENVNSFKIFCKNFGCLEDFFEDYVSISKIHKKDELETLFEKIAGKYMG